MRSQSEELDHLVYPAGPDTRGAGSVPPQDVYHQNSTLKTTPARGRGRISDVDVAPGGWLDLDVKEGAFTSHGDILDFAWGNAGRRWGSSRASS